MSDISEENLSVANRFKEMNVSLGMESRALAITWLEEHGKSFKGFVDGCWALEAKFEEIESDFQLHKVRDHFSGEYLCDVYTSDARLLSDVSNLAKSGFEKWSSQSAVSRSKSLYNVAKAIEKYQELFSIIESLSSGKHLARVKAKDIPNLIESFSYYAGCALKLQDSKTLAPLGPVCVITDKYGSPTFSLGLPVSSLLAAGNSVVILADVQDCLSAFLLAEICSRSGIPENVLNVLPISDESGFELDVFSKVLYYGWLNRLTDATEELSPNTHVDLLIPLRPAVIVYESADLHAAAEGVLEAFFCHNTKSDASGCKVMIQQSIAKKFLKILEEAFSKTLTGNNLSKADMYIITDNQNEEISNCLTEAAMHAKVYKLPCNEEPSDSYIQPMIISGVQTGFKLVHEELGGPIIVAVTFRTVKESISMFNCDNKGSPVSIWTEITSVALDVADKIKSGTVWVNSQNVFDAEIPFSGIYSSGNSTVGGKEAFFSHLKTLPEATDINKPTYDEDISAYADSPANAQSKDMKEYKLYIDGEQKKSAENKIFSTSRSIISYGSKADIQLAVSYALSAQPKWQILTKHKKRQIILSIAKTLEMKKEDFVSELVSCQISEVESRREVSDSLDILYHWAFQSDNYEGEVKNIPGNKKVLQVRCPLGIIGIQSASDKPLLSFIRLLAPAIAFGNAVIIVPSQVFPEPALKMCEIFSLCGVPKGVINVISGSQSVLIPYMSQHGDVNAIWFTNSTYFVNRYLSYSQRAYEFSNISSEFNEAMSLKCVMRSTYIKSIFLPSGEIFAN